MPEPEATADGSQPPAQPRAERPTGTRAPDSEPEPPVTPDGEDSERSRDTDGEVPAEAEPPGATPSWLQQVPYLLVMATMSAGIVVVAAAHFKRGPALIAGALLLAAVFRATLGEERAGMLSVRGRWFDVATLLILAGALIVLAWVAPQL